MAAFCSGIVYDISFFYKFVYDISFFDQIFKMFRCKLFHRILSRPKDAYKQSTMTSLRESLACTFLRFHFTIFARYVWYD
jgi:hypothetical protein